MQVFTTIYLFIVGLASGSFALVLADRMKIDKDWVRGRSECESCHTTLKPIDLIPIFSWLSTQGRCRYCHIKLSQSYPIAELGTGVAFALSYVFWPVELTGVVAILMFCIWLVALVVMAALFIFDIRWFLLPNKLIYPLIGLGLVWAILDISQQSMTAWVLINYLLAVLVGSGIFAAIYAVSKGQWIGDGDIRLGVAIGLFTGHWAGAWLVLLTASITGLIASIPAIIKADKKSRHKLRIPFGPLLMFGLFIAVLFGQDIIDWYFSGLFL